MAFSDINAKPQECQVCRGQGGGILLVLPFGQRARERAIRKKVGAALIENGVLTVTLPKTGGDQAEEDNRSRLFQIDIARHRL